MKMIIPGTKLRKNLIYVGIMFDEKDGGHYHLLAKNEDEKELFTWSEAIKPRDEFVCPTSKELHLMRTIAEELGMKDWYWASTEYDNNVAWVQRFSGGLQDGYDKFNAYLLRYVRRVDDLTLQALLNGESKEESALPNSQKTEIQNNQSTTSNKSRTKEKLYAAALQGLLANGFFSADTEQQHATAANMARTAKASVDAILKIMESPNEEK